MDYKVVKSNNNYNVFETKTEHNVATYLTETQARVIARMYNLGAGFAGWTPKFILQKNDVKEFLNESAD
jgi:hypothetical protein